jgi:hypothetical protein
VLQRFFSFAKADGAQFDREPKWTELQLPEPEERVRELQEEEAVVALFQYDAVHYQAAVPETASMSASLATRLAMSCSTFVTCSVPQTHRGTSASPSVLPNGVSE